MTKSSPSAEAPPRLYPDNSPYDGAVGTLIAPQVMPRMRAEARSDGNLGDSHGGAVGLEPDRPQVPNKPIWEGDQSLSAPGRSFARLLFSGVTGVVLGALVFGALTAIESFIGRLDPGTPFVSLLALGKPFLSLGMTIAYVNSDLRKPRLSTSP